MSYLVLARKWRPKGFDDLIGQEPLMRILKNAIVQDKIAHAYLFSGPRGVGKTSTARILAKAVNCKEGPTPIPCGFCDSCTAITEGSSVDVIEIDGASNNSVDDIRDLRERVKYAPSSSKYKLYIIDEVHMLSGSAFNALLKTLEEPPSHIIFVLATTAIKKIPATILSRCQHMPFRRISSADIRARLKDISEAEEINVSYPALSLIARAADGSMRDALTILDQLSSFSTEITEENIKNLLGIADIGMLSRIAKAIISGNRVEVLETIEVLAEHGTDFRSFTKELVQFFRDLLVASVMSKPEDILDLNDDEMSAVKDIIADSTEDQLTLMLSEIMKAETDVRNSSLPRLALEMSLMKASFLSTMKPIKEVIETIDRYSKQFAGQVPDNFTIKDKAETESTPLSKGPHKKIVHPVEKKRSEVQSDKAIVESADDRTLKEEALSEQTSGEDRDITQIWEKALEKIDAPLASKIAHADIELKGDKLFLTLNGGHAVFEDDIRRNIKSIEKIVEQESGSPIKVKIVTLHKKSPGKKELKEKIKEEPVIKEALELFEGRVVDITTIEKSVNSKNGGDYV